MSHQVNLTASTNLELPDGHYTSPAWLGEWIYVQFDEPDVRVAFQTRIVRFKSDGSRFEFLELPPHSGCGPEGDNGYLTPQSLPDGRLSVITNCRPKDDLFADNNFLIAYDPHNQEIQNLLPEATPFNNVGTGGFAWNPDMTIAISGDAHRYINEQLYKIEDGEWEQLDLGLVQAFSPVWSLDGNQIALVGSKIMGSPTRLSPYVIYLMDQDLSNPIPFMEDLYLIGGLSWSPDGRWLAFPASFGRPSNWTHQGLWIADPDTGEHWMIAEGEFGRPSWSPDGDQLAVIEFVGQPGDVTYRPVLIEVPDDLQP